MQVNAPPGGWMGCRPMTRLFSLARAYLGFGVALQKVSLAIISVGGEGKQGTLMPQGHTAGLI